MITMIMSNVPEIVLDLGKGPMKSIPIVSHG